MKTLVVTTSYPTTEDDPSGHFVRTEARALANAGDEVHVIAPGTTNLSTPQEDRPRLLIHRAGGSALFGWPGAIEKVRKNPLALLASLPFFLAARAAITRIGTVDRAIAHWIVPSGVPILMGHQAPLELVAHGADVRLLLATPRTLREPMLRQLLDRNATFRFAAQASLDTLADALPHPLASRLRTASHVSPMQIETPDPAALHAHARALRDGLGPFGRDKLAVIVGRLVEDKRVDLAIEAASMAALSLVVVGDGPARTKLETLAKKLDARVKFTGLVRRSEALAWIAAADVLMHTSRAEAAPTAVREARTLGVPVVACASGDLQTWAHTDPGIVLVTAEAPALAVTLTARRAADGMSRGRTE